VFIRLVAGDLTSTSKAQARNSTEEYTPGLLVGPGRECWSGQLIYTVNGTHEITWAALGHGRGSAGHVCFHALSLSDH